MSDLTPSLASYRAAEAQFLRALAQLTADPDVQAEDRQRVAFVTIGAVSRILVLGDLG